MALKMFRDKVVPRVGDLVRPRMIVDMTGIVVAIKDNENDAGSEFFKGSPRKIFIVRWISGHQWAKQSIRTEYQAHQLEVISKAQNEKH